MGDDFKTAIGQGPSFRDLGNAVSEAIHAALSRGMEVEEACSVVVAVAADYGRGTYGPTYLAELAHIVTERANHKLPEGL
jgi:hypothetical protein